MAARSSIRTDGHPGWRLPTVTTGIPRRSSTERSAGTGGTLRMIAPSARFQSMVWVIGSLVSKVWPSRSQSRTWKPSSRSTFSIPLTTVAKNQRLK